MRDRVLRLDSESAASGDRMLCLGSDEAEVMESRYDMVACSSAKVERSWFAIYVARVEDEDVADGTEFGRYVTSRTEA